MINLLEGIPGSGKSYEAVVHHILPALQSGRKVITNIPLNMDAFRMLFPQYVPLIEIRRHSMPILGRWDAEAANRGEMAFILGEFAEPAKLVIRNGEPYLPPKIKPPLFGSVWDFYDTWRGEGNIGPLYVIDECHVSFPRLKPGRGVMTSDEVIQWFKLSRHFGSDLLLMTQRMSALDDDIAGLAEFHIRLRKASALGKPNSYIRKVFAGYKGGELSVSEREYESKYFILYQSHTQGSAVREATASDVSPFVAKWKKGSWVFAAFTIAFTTWAFWPKSKTHADKFQADIAKTPPGHTLKYENGKPVHVPTAPAAAAPVSQDVPKVEQQPAAVQQESVNIDPLDGKKLHLSGTMVFKGKTLHTFEVSDGSVRLLSTDSEQLQLAGYTYRHLAHCMGVLTWGGKDRAVTCDAPRVASGREEKPHVIMDPRADAPASAASPAQHVDAANPHPLTAAAKTSTLVQSGSL